MSIEGMSLQTWDQNQRKWMNRRAAVRYRCAPATVGKVFPVSKGEPLLVCVFDLSRTGVGLLTNIPLMAAQELTLQISSPSSNEKFDFLVQVAHITQQVNGEWLVGLVFQQPLTDEQLDKLLY
jgi:hypothetical protein